MCTSSPKKARGSAFIHLRSRFPPFCPERWLTVSARPVPVRLRRAAVPLLPANITFNTQTARSPSQKRSRLPSCLPPLCQDSPTLFQISFMCVRILRWRLKMSNVVVKTFGLTDFSRLFSSLPMTCDLREICTCGGGSLAFGGADRSIIGCNYTVSHGSAKVHVAFKIEEGSEMDLS